jgi:hypothetical protein
LPARLGKDSLQLMAQGPRSLYAYWEITASDAGPLTLILEERPTGHGFVLSRNLPLVGEFWLPARPEHAYRVWLRRADGTDLRLSNLIVTARDRPASPGDASPVWLDRLLADGAVDELHAADRWAAVFPETLEMFRGVPSWPIDGDGSTLPADRVPASQPPPLPVAASEEERRR